MLYDHALVYNYEKFYLMFVLLAAIILTVILATHAFCVNLPRRNKNSLLALHGVVLLLQTSQFLAVVAPPKELTFHVSGQGIALLMLGPAFYIHVHVLICRKFLKPLQAALLLAIPVTGALLVLTNSWHNLFFTFHDAFYVRFSAAFFYFSAYNYLCAFTAILLLYMRYKKKRENGGADLRWVAAATGAVLLILAIDLFEFRNPAFFPYDLTPATIALAQIIFRLAGVSPSRYKSLLTARINVLDSLNESIIMTDRNNKILYLNQTPLNKMLCLKIGAGIDVLNQDQLIEPTLDFRETVSEGEFMCGGPEDKKVFSYAVTPLHKGQRQKSPVGKLYTFREITVYKTLISSLDAKNMELAAALERLRKHMRVVKQLAEERERNKIMQYVISTVGNCISGIINTLAAADFLKGRKEANRVVIKDKIEKSIRFARDGINKTRESVSTLHMRSETEREGGK